MFGTERVMSMALSSTERERIQWESGQSAIRQYIGIEVFPWEGFESQWSAILSTAVEAMTGTAAIVRMAIIIPIEINLR